MGIKANHELLIGTWVGGADDGSGLRTMVYNYGITLNEDGSGISFSWNKEKQRIEETEDQLAWELMDNGILKIREIDLGSASTEWETIAIEITDFIGAYNSQHYKIVNKGKSTFWDFPEPLYKSKYQAKKEGWLQWIWKGLIGRKADSRES